MGISSLNRMTVDKCEELAKKYAELIWEEIDKLPITQQDKIIANRYVIKRLKDDAREF